MAREKRERKRIPKDERKSLRLWAEGLRQEVLEPHIEGYAAALAVGKWTVEREYLRKVCREYHARIDWRLEDHEEPDSLRPFDPETRIEKEVLSPEEEKAKSARVDELDKRIRRWLKYRCRSLRKRGQIKVKSTKDPWALLLAQLSGIKTPPKKARQGWQQWMHEDPDTVALEIQKRWAVEPAAGASVRTTKEPNAPFRAKVAHEMFKERFTKEEQKAFTTRAQKESADARVAYKEGLERAPSRSADARHEAIENVGEFLAPILRGIEERTGLHSVVILGGPMPKYDGQLRTIHVSYGRNNNATPSHMPQWAKERFTPVLSLMKEYLNTAFGPEDIKAAMRTSSTASGLEGAKYTIEPDGQKSPKSESSSDDSGSESDSDSASDSDDDTESESDSDSDTEGLDAGKKRKRGKGKQRERAGKKAKTVPVRAMTTVGGSEYERQREARIQANKLLMKPIQDAVAALLPPPKKKAPANRKPRNPTGGPNAPSRKSGRLAAPSSSAPAVLLTGASTIIPVLPVLPALPPPVLATDGSTAVMGLGLGLPPPTLSALATNAPPPVLPVLATNAATTVIPAVLATNDPPPALAVDVVATGAPTTVIPAVLATNDLPPALALDVVATNAAATVIPAVFATNDPPPALALDVVATNAPPPALVIPLLPAMGTITRENEKEDVDMPDVVSTGGPVPCFPNATPAALKAAIVNLTAVDLGDNFKALLEAVIRVEEAYGFVEDAKGGLPTANRPTIVKDWIRGARGTKSKKPPSITKLKEYSSRWKLWWDSLQPDWRTVDSEKRWKVGGEYGDNWEVFDCPGINGVLNLAAALYFWGSQARKSRDVYGEEWFSQEQTLWDDAVADVGWMLDGLHEYLTT